MPASRIHRRHPALLPALILMVALFNVADTSRTSAQNWIVVETQTRASFRGLSVAPDGAIWVGGTHGTVLQSTDRGATWSIDSVPGARAFDLRGMAAIDVRSAYAMVAHADTGRIYKTEDKGRTWQLQYQDERPGVFLDGLECWDALRCLSVGDPIDGRFLVISTTDGGAHWVELPPANSPAAAKGEAIFAASASSVVVGAGGKAWVVTGGGPVARVWQSSDYGASWRAVDTPVTAGASSAGLFSIAFCADGRGVAVGGDYRSPAGTGSHVAVSTDGGVTWTAGDPGHTTPYLSGVACAHFEGLNDMVAVGPTGTVLSNDGGKTWPRLDQTGFNAVVVTPAETGAVAIAVGENGAIAHLILKAIHPD